MESSAIKTASLRPRKLRSNSIKRKRKYIKNTKQTSKGMSSASMEVEFSSFEEDNYSNSSEDDWIDVQPEKNSIEPNSFAVCCNKVLLFLPIAIALIFRSICDHEFRTLAIAWTLLLPFTSHISLDEAVFPALLASSLGYDNSVVRRNMYISIARSRIGLLALLLLSVYTSDYHILGCGILLRLLITFAKHILQNSISVSEITLICGAVVNIIYHCVGDAFLHSNISDPVSLIFSGLGAALPCYPLFARFVHIYRKKRGCFRQWPWAVAIYTVYLSTAVYLYFFVFAVKLADIGAQVAQNIDLIAYWCCILLNAFCIAFYFGTRLELDGRRKLWHLCAVSMFLPSWIRGRTFTKLALAVVLVLFIALETARATVLPPFGKLIHRMLHQFVDYRDKRGPVVISHLYLLLGILVPIFLAQSPAGLICLGLGDTFASQIGRRYGRHRIFGHKSLEGTLAFAVVAALALSLSTSGWSITSYKTWLVVVPTALLEAVTPLNDNLIVPVYMLSLQGLLAENPGSVRTWGF